MNQEPLAAISTDMATVPATADPPRKATKRVAFGLLWLAIPFAVLVLCVMAATSASATGGCGGG